MGCVFFSLSSRDLSLLKHPLVTLNLKHTYIHTGAIFSNDEVKILIRTRHERLVMFFGCGIADDGGYFLVMEFMDSGSLDRTLWNDSTTTVSKSWMQRIQILIDVADGLGYLHLYHKTIHLDLKSPNILLEKIVSNDDATRRCKSVTHRAKIADFGLSKIFNTCVGAQSS